MLTAATIIVVPLAIDLTTIANAQQQQQQPSNQTAGIENGTLYQNTMDKFRVQVPAGWVIQTVNNTGSTLESEALQGYGLLAQLCPEGDKQQVGRASLNVNSNSGNTASCQGSEGDIIHIVRYPDLNAKVGFTFNNFVRDYNGTAKAILAYQLQKLQEVGYRNIQIVNSTDRKIDVDIRTTALEMIGNNSKALPPLARVPAKLLEMTYSTASAPNEIRTGYILLTATGVVSPNPKMATGYAVFYEVNPKAAAIVTPTTAATTTTYRGLAPIPLPAAVRQVFDSFELMASEGTIQAILAALSTQLSAQVGQAQQLGQVYRIVTIHTTQTQVTGGSISPLAGTMSVNATEGTAPATFEFKANIVGGVKPYTFSWNFGDGTKEGNKQTVVHTFKEAGTYTVTAGVIDGQHTTGSAGLKIIVKEPSPSEQMGKTICDSSNSDLCIRPPTANSNCDDTSAQSFGAVPPGLHTLDTNNDGTGCGSESSQGNSQPRNSSSEDNSNSGSNGNSGSPNSISLFDLLNSGSSTHAP